MDTLKQTFRVVVDYGLTLAQMIEAGRYDHNSIDLNFPVTGSGQAEVNIEILHFGRKMTYHEILVEMQKQDYRPATVAELLALGVAFPDVQRGITIAALGSTLPASRGGRLVPVLEGYPNERYAYIVWDREGMGWHSSDYGWHGRYRFAAVRKTA